jgi:hypothetical protein
VSDSKFSELDNEEREQVVGYVRSRWAQYYTASREARKDAANFIATANAGGAATLLAFSGAILKESSPLAKAFPLRLAIVLFAAGMLASGLAHAVEYARLGGLFAYWRKDVDLLYNDKTIFKNMREDDSRRATENEVVALMLIWIALACFGIGVACGALLLLEGA